VETCVKDEINDKWGNKRRTRIEKKNYKRGRVAQERKVCWITSSGEEKNKNIRK
jgi:hypothetical protein